jgi:hypothetical protein
MKVVALRRRTQLTEAEAAEGIVVSWRGRAITCPPPCAWASWPATVGVPEPHMGCMAWPDRGVSDMGAMLLHTAAEQDLLTGSDL